MSNIRKRSELVNPPRIVNNSVEANLALYISWRERMTVNNNNEDNMELPDPAISLQHTIPNAIRSMDQAVLQ